MSTLFLTELVALVLVLLFVAGAAQGFALWSGTVTKLRAAVRQGSRGELFIGWDAGAKAWQRLKWMSVWGGAGAAFVLYEYRFSVLGVVALVLTSTALAGLLFALRREQYARSYARAGREQQRQAARRRAAQRRSSARARDEKRQQASKSDDAPLRAARMPVREALRVLGLPEEADYDKLHAAYRRQAKKHHPDRYAQHSETVQTRQKRRFQEVQQARATLERHYAQRERTFRGETA